MPFTVIRPTKPPPDPRKVMAEAQTIMEGFGADLQRAMAKYPPQAAAAAPRYERRRAGRTAKGRIRYRRVQVGGYKRTRTLARSWHFKTEVGGNRIVTTVATDGTAPYAVYVEGPRDTKPGQSRLMQSRGWQSVAIEGEKQWKKAVRKLSAMMKGLS